MQLLKNVFVYYSFSIRNKSSFPSHSEDCWDISFDSIILLRPNSNTLRTVLTTVYDCTVVIFIPHNICGNFLLYFWKIVHIFFIQKKSQGLMSARHCLGRMRSRSPLVLLWCMGLMLGPILKFRHRFQLRINWKQPNSPSFLLLGT